MMEARLIDASSDDVGDLCQGRHGDRGVDCTQNALRIALVPIDDKQTDRFQIDEEFGIVIRHRRPRRAEVYASRTGLERSSCGLAELLDRHRWLEPPRPRVEAPPRRRRGG